MNCFRPSYFGLEAQPEVTAFVRAFDMTVSDPQIDGMGGGEYDAERFLSGWNKGNEFGYAAILRDPNNREGIATLPTAKLLQAWQWNLHKLQLQLELAPRRFLWRKQDQRAFVEALPLDQRPFEGLTSDKLLDQELVAKHLG